MVTKVLQQVMNRFLQHMARFGPGADTLRPLLHKWRGVKIENGVWIGYDVIIETECPELVTIGKGASIGIRSTVIAHYHELRGVNIMEGAYIGPGCLIMPNVTIGQDAVVMAGSIVSQSVLPRTVVQGNPAKAIAECRVPLKTGVSVRQFSKNLRPIKKI